MDGDPKCAAKNGSGEGGRNIGYVLTALARADELGEGDKVHESKDILGCVGAGAGEVGTEAEALSVASAAAAVSPA